MTGAATIAACRADSTWPGPAGVWAPVLPHLPANVRFLAYNQRSYEGSSEAFGVQKEGGTDATAAYLQDLLGFVDFAVEQLGVPGIGADGKGGVALLVSRSANGHFQGERARR